MANDFSGDSSVKALWRFESGALTVDSIGANTLTAFNTPTDAAAHKEGSNAVALVNASHQYFTIADVDLDAGFPLKNGDAVKLLTICGWFYANSLSAQRYLWGKCNFSTSARGGVMASCYNNALYFTWAGVGGTQVDTLITSSLITGHFYHLTVLADGIHKTVEAYLWDDTVGNLVHIALTNITPDLAINADAFRIGAFPDQNSAYTWDGYIDEVVVFNRLLTSLEARDIRLGIFLPVSYSNFPIVLTNAVDGVPGIGTPLLAKHLNNLEAKVGIDGSTIPTSLDFLVKNPASNKVLKNFVIQMILGMPFTPANFLPSISSPDMVNLPKLYFYSIADGIAVGQAYSADGSAVKGAIYQGGVVTLVASPDMVNLPLLYFYSIADGIAVGQAYSADGSASKGAIYGPIQ